MSLRNHRRRISLSAPPATPSSLDRNRGRSVGYYLVEVLLILPLQFLIIYSAIYIPYTLFCAFQGVDPWTRNLFMDIYAPLEVGHLLSFRHTLTLHPLDALLRLDGPPPPLYPAYRASARAFHSIVRETALYTHTRRFQGSRYAQYLCVGRGHLDGRLCCTCPPPRRPTIEPRRQYARGPHPSAAVH